jgi:hypothetical protein
VFQTLPSNRYLIRRNDDAPRRMTSNEKLHYNEVSSHTNERLLRPG